MASLVLLFFIGMVGFGAFQSVTAKLFYQTSATGSDGTVRYFNKPWYQLWVMFLAMASLLLIYFYKILCDYFFGSKEEKESSKTPTKMRTYFQMALPACCDLLSTILMNIALLWVSVSVCQMLRSLIVIFTGIFTIFIRKRKLFRFEYVGGLLVVLAVIILGFVEVMDEGDTEERIVDVKLVLLGICLMIIAQAVQGFQDIVEEALMHEITTPPTLLVGVEGVWGFVLMTVVFIPLLSYLPFEEGTGLRESFSDTVAMLRDNYNLVLFSLFYYICSCGFNFFYFLTMDSTNALTTDIVQQMRNLLVWGMAVFVHYTIDPSYGEGWDWWSVLELIAFILMCTGIFVFHGVIKIGWLAGDAEVPVAFPVPAGSPFTVDGTGGALGQGGKEYPFEVDTKAKAKGYDAVVEEGRALKNPTASYSLPSSSSSPFPASSSPSLPSSSPSPSGFLSGIKDFMSFVSPQKKPTTTSSSSSSSSSSSPGAGSEGGEREPLLYKS